MPTCEASLFIGGSVNGFRICIISFRLKSIGGREPHTILSVKDKHPLYSGPSPEYYSHDEKKFKEFQDTYRIVRAKADKEERCLTPQEANLISHKASIYDPFSVISGNDLQLVIDKKVEEQVADENSKPLVRIKTKSKR